MRIIMLLAGAASLALGAPALAQGNGHGGGGGGPPGGGGGKEREAKGGPEKGGGDRDKGPKGGGPEKAGFDRGGPDKGGPKRMAEQRDNAGPRERWDNRQQRAEKQDKPDKRYDNERGPEYRAGNDDRWRDDRGYAAKEAKPKDGKALAGRDAWREDTRLFVDRTWDGNRYRYDDRAYVIPTNAWCPPGLAKKNNGCLPPGQARKLDQYDGWSNWYPVRYRDDGYDWRYNDGYMYRTGDGGLITALIPLIGGALFGGQVWPQQYTGYDAPDYYDSYYGDGYGGSYDYRVAQNAIFAVDPGSGQIDGIAGLLTGDHWSVGERMPIGYDVYNVPPSYRDRYSDRDDAMYRYSDGYVYEVDPTTQLVRAVMELLV